MGPLMQSGFAGEIEPWQNGYAWKHCQGPTRSASMSKSWDWERPRKIQQHPTFKKERDRNDCLRLLVQVVLQSHQCHTQFSNKRLDLQLSGWDRFGDQFAHLFTGSSFGLRARDQALGWTSRSSFSPSWCRGAARWSAGHWGRGHAPWSNSVTGTHLLPLFNVVWWCNVLLNTIQLSSIVNYLYGFVTGCGFSAMSLSSLTSWYNYLTCMSSQVYYRIRVSVCQVHWPRPLQEDPSNYGRLLVRFTVNFPDRIPTKVAHELQNALAELPWFHSRHRMCGPLKFQESVGCIQNGDLTCSPHVLPLVLDPTVLKHGGSTCDFA